MTRAEHRTQIEATTQAAERDYSRGRFFDAAARWRLVQRYAECAGDDAFASAARVAAATCEALAVIGDHGIPAEVR